MWFQHYRAPFLNGISIREHLDRAAIGRRIGRRGLDTWRKTTWIISLFIITKIPISTKRYKILRWILLQDLRVCWHCLKYYLPIMRNF
ncbi:hypothetical protein TNIN_155191 [Trichonephila inaurata madagascariensis]|uniref:Uncharacterized protein n=1 Tax=Trichonephila inaurata madagascariensis TaxID=2747483 RepID=A0A8X6YBX2_9ARAC|nr:hypothetical protein TNIN_155191 [Trichonephila inaurata madagascariensis]